MAEWDDWKDVLSRLTQLIERDFDICDDRQEGCPSCDLMTARDKIESIAKITRDQ